MPPASAARATRRSRRDGSPRSGAVARSRPILKKMASGMPVAFRHNSRHMEKIRAAVVGVVDVQPETAARVAAETQTTAYPDFRALLGKVDAVSVVTPTPTHYDIARAFLESGAHVLVEKPIADSTAQAERLIGAARQYGRVLQVGHLERFNPTILAAESPLARPRIVVCH